MNIEKNALMLIDLAYGAVLEPAKWQQVIAQFVAVIGANSAVLREVNYNTGTVGLFNTVGYDPALKQAYRDYYIHQDIFAAALKESSTGDIILSTEAVPWSRQLKSEFYNDYMRPQGGRYVLGATLAKDAQSHLLLGIQRAEQQGDFTPEDLVLIRQVTPHIARAAQIHRQLQSVTSQQQWALSALNRLATGVVLLDERGHPRFVNKSAEWVLNNAGCLIADDGILLGNVTDTVHLHRLIVGAAGCATGKGCPPGGNLVLYRHGQTVCLQVVPIARDSFEQPWSPGLSDTCVAVFISTTHSSEKQHRKAIARYGFTPAEARLAILLMKGIDLEAAATQLSVSVQTVRSQLKSIFAKTNVNRQAELVSRLLSNLLLECTTD